MPFLINIYIYAHIRMTHAYVLRAPVHAQLHKVHIQMIIPIHA